MMLERINKLYFWYGIGFILVLPLFYLSNCSAPTENIELRKGIDVLRYMSSEGQLKRSSFIAGYPEGTPEDFLNWMFSEMGAAEWPPYEGGMEFSPEEEAMVKKTGIPFIPKNLLLIPNEPEMERGRQVVIIADNENNQLIAEGYEDPAELPVVIKKWAFPELGGG
ncbi:MAG: hypothetical protein VW455_03315 [Nitrospinota bacterium]